MNKNIIKKVRIAVLSVVALMMLLLSFGILWSYSQIRQHKGSNIETINPIPLVKKYSQLGIKNIHLLSPENDHFILGNIVLQDGNIHAITEIDSLLTDIEYIDGNGKYLIPGLIDTHVHLLDSKNDLYLYLANGVTSVFEMYGTDTHIKWKREVEAGAIGPDLFVASRKIGSREGFTPEIEDWMGQHINITSKKEAIKVVREHKEMGYDALKLSSYLNLETYNHILEAAKSEQIPVMGHLSSQIGLKNLFGSGQAQIAHVEELVKATMDDFDGYVYNDPEKYLNYLQNNADAIAIKLKKDSIAVSTTIWLMESLPNQKFELQKFIPTIPIKYVNSGIVEGSELYAGWLPGNNDYEYQSLEDDPQAYEQEKKYLSTFVKAIHIITQALYSNDVMLMVGTDANVPGIVPGFSIHDEMKSLSNLGLSNEDILKAAITIPAKFMKSNTGKIQVKYKANLVMLSDNPLESIENTKRIEKVFFNNYSINNNQIKSILNLIRQANDAGRKINI